MPSTAAPRRLIRLPEVIRMVGLSSTSIYDRIQGKTFPKPIKLGRSSLWVEADIQSWIDALIDGAQERH